MDDAITAPSPVAPYPTSVPTHNLPQYQPIPCLSTAPYCITPYLSAAPYPVSVLHRTLPQYWGLGSRVSFLGHHTLSQYCTVPCLSTGPHSTSVLHHTRPQYCTIPHLTTAPFPISLPWNTAYFTAL
eukprot:2829655-Rhodomonas_salina.1